VREQMENRNMTEDSNMNTYSTDEKQTKNPEALKKQNAGVLSVLEKCSITEVRAILNFQQNVK